jgi:hypothetical protein
MIFEVECLISVFFINLSFLATSCGAMARSPEPAIFVRATPQAERLASRKTVADYFLEIPEQYLKVSDNDRFSITKRQQFLEAAKQGDLLRSIPLALRAT